MAHESTDSQTLAIDHDLTIYTAADTRAALQAALLAQPRLRLDLSAVGEIDTAGFQLLLAAARQAAAAGGHLAIAPVADCVRELFAFYRVPQLLAA